MMAHVNQKCACKWTSAQTQTRFKSMMSTYKRVRLKFYDTTGAKYCLTIEEAQSGITIQTKVDKECFGFFRLEALFAGRQNMTPSYLEEPNEEEVEEERSVNTETGMPDTQASDSPYLTRSQKKRRRKKEKRHPRRRRRTREARRRRVGSVLPPSHHHINHLQLVWLPPLFLHFYFFSPATPSHHNK